MPGGFFYLKVVVARVNQRRRRVFGQRLLHHRGELGVEGFEAREELLPPLVPRRTLALQGLASWAAKEGQGAIGPTGTTTSLS